MKNSNEESLRAQLIAVVTAFQRDQMSVTAESVFVDLHPGSLVITVRRAISVAEQDCTRDKEGRDLLDRFYCHLYEVSKQILEKAVEAILGHPVTHSRVSVDAESANQVILVTFGGEHRAPLSELARVAETDASQLNDERFLQAHMDWKNYWKLKWIENPTLHRFVAEITQLCNPDVVFVCSDSPDDINWVRQHAITSGEETRLITEGHTYHLDGLQDQEADKDATKYLVPASDSLPEQLNQIDREEGVAEIRGLLKNSMAGRTMIVRFLCLGPKDSIFSIPYVQCTDSFYVAHSQDLLYRAGYEQFRKFCDTADFLRAVHSAGRIDANMVSMDTDKKRVYIDYTCDTVYSVNTQYAGNTVGLEGLGQGLATCRAGRQGWLDEHMSIISVLGPSGRKSYIAGAFPDGSGAEPTGRQSDETVVGHGATYLRAVDGAVRAAGAKEGVFGIIGNLNQTDNPATYKALTVPGDVIFSNVLIKDGKPYWPGMGGETPQEGMNSVDSQPPGKKDGQRNSVPSAGGNARYTVSLRGLDNADPQFDDPLGVDVRGIIYSGRDDRTCVPVQQSFDWKHGIITYGAALEEKVALAVIEQQGQHQLKRMNVGDFMSLPLGNYIGDRLDFIDGISKPPLIFGINYFEYSESARSVSSARENDVWLKWIELRTHGEADGIATPTGYIPSFEVLVGLFREVLGKDYLLEHYLEHFTTCIAGNIEKIERIEKFYRANAGDAPQMLFDVLQAQKERLERARRQFGDYISPLDIANAGFESS